MKSIKQQLFDLLVKIRLDPYDLPESTHRGYWSSRSGELSWTCRIGNSGLSEIGSFDTMTNCIRYRKFWEFSYDERYVASIVIYCNKIKELKGQ
jgi:hypothetical protein